MENSAFEALMIGVNVFVFIIALSAAVILMSNVINMVNYANENAIRGMNGSLAESVGVVHNRIYSGEQVLAYYGNLEKYNNYNFAIKLSELGNAIPLKSYIESESIYNYIDEQFELQYRGVVDSKESFVFIIKSE